VGNILEHLYIYIRILVDIVDYDKVYFDISQYTLTRNDTRAPSWEDLGADPSFIEL
jgi:hypothetical protein